MIYSGGISITDREIEYVNDALKTGWDKNHDSYIKRFEETFANYIGVKYARAVSGGTQALLLGLATLDIGPGDEVILPDLTYFACSDVILELGATPVFADVLMDTWCIDPVSIKSNITPRTKAIMPVWLYGNSPEMDEIKLIAKQYNLAIIEDSCPAVGSMYGGEMAGSFGDFGCFSFHGSKIMTTGFGGMIVTDNKELYDKMMWINNHGENAHLPFRFWQNRAGYSFDLSNISCAMGLAQIERIEELVSAKRQIFIWYKDRLGDIEGLDMNYENMYVSSSNMWMTSIILNRDFPIGRDALIRGLKRMEIDTRPFFFPISEFPMYERTYTPNAHHLGYRGLNLPSGVQRTEDEIDYISSCVRKLLCA